MLTCEMEDIQTNIQSLNHVKSDILLGNSNIMQRRIMIGKKYEHDGCTYLFQGTHRLSGVALNNWRSNRASAVSVCCHVGRL